MANQINIDIGAAANDGTGDPLRTAFNYVNLNFANVWATGLPNSNVQFNNNRILTVNTNANLILAPNGTGIVQSNVSILPNIDRVHNLGSTGKKWNNIYANYLNINQLEINSDLTVGGNLTVQGNTIQIGNIVTDTKTIQLSNTAANTAAANGSGITVGANDNIATLLYNSSSNVWTTNIGISAVGNITASYFVGNGSLLTGITSYANANAVAYGESGWAGNIIPAGNNVYNLGNASNQWNDLYISNATIFMNNVPVSLTAGNVLTVAGNSVVTVSSDTTANLANIGIDNNNIFNTQGQGVIISNFNYVTDEAETAFVYIPAGNSPSELQVVQEQGDVRLTANTATWLFSSSGNLNIPNNIVGASTIRIDNRATGNTADIQLFAADDITLQARDRDPGSGTEGGDININAGDSAEDGDASGGDIQIIAGNGGAANVDFGGQGGFITIRSGDGGAAIGDGVSVAEDGGDITIQAGSAGDNNGNANRGAGAGDVFITSGFSTGNNISGGNIYLTTGAGGPNGAAGIVQVEVPSSDLGAGGTWTFGATGNLTLPQNGNINSADGWTARFQTLDEGEVRAGITLTPGYGLTRLESFDNQNSNGYTTSDWNTGEYINNGGSGEIVFTDAPSIISFFSTIDTSRVFYQVNGGNLLPSAGFGSGGNNITFYTAIPPATSPETVTSFTIYYSNRSAIEMDYDEGEMNLIARDLDINITSDQSIDLVTRDIIRLQNTGNSSGVAVITDAGNAFHIWNFLPTGNLALPLGGVISEGPSPSYLGNAVTITPANGNDSNQQLKIYPTVAEGNHLHLTSGNLAVTDVFLGDDRQYIRTTTTEGMTIGTGGGEIFGGYVWSFDNGGALTFPDGSNISNGALNGTASSSVSLNALSPDGNTVSIQAQGNSSSAVISIFSNAGPVTSNWTFTTAPLDPSESLLYIPNGGTISTPNATGGEGGKNIFIQAGASDPVTWNSNPGGELMLKGGYGSFGDGGGGPGGNVNISGGESSDSHAGNVNIASGLNTWVFDYNGNLTLPTDSFSVNYANGTPISLGGNYGDSNVVSLMSAFGSNTISTTGNISGGNLISSGTFESASISSTGNIISGAGRHFILGNATSSLRQNSSNATVNLGGSITLTPDTGASALNGVTIGGNGYLLAPNGARVLTLGGNNALTVSGNLTLGGSIGSSRFTTLGETITGANAIVAGQSPVILANSSATFSANVNNYTQITFQNRNTGTDATADYILTADNGNDTTNFGDFGIINSGYDNSTPTNSLGNIVFAADTYVYAQGNISNTAQSGGNLVIGTTTAGKNVKIFAGGNTASALIANISNTGISVAGNVTASNFTGNINITGNIQGTTANVQLVAGSYTATFDNTGVLTLPTIGGNEGGEINFGIPAANTTLIGPVKVDVFQDRIRFFDGSTKGAYIDLSQAATGVNTLLNNRVSGLVDAGTFVTMDNIKATVTGSAPRGLSLATVSGSFTYNIGGTYGSSGVGNGGSSAGGQTLTTTPTGSIFGWGFTVSGDIATYTLTDTTNGRCYRITVQIGGSFLNNSIIIERLI